jgi:hypothetical protein
MKNRVFWDVMPCDSCKNRRFGGTERLPHQGDKNRWTRNNTSCNYQPAQRGCRLDWCKKLSLCASPQFLSTHFPMSGAYIAFVIWRSQYLHRSPANRKRRQKGNPISNETAWYGLVLWELNPSMTALARPSSTCASKLYTHPLVREGVPY